MIRHRLRHLGKAIALRGGWYWRLGWWLYDACTRAEDVDNDD